MSVTTVTIIAAAVVAPALVAVITLVVAIAVTAAIVPAITVTTTALLIARHVFTFVPAVLDKIDPLAAGTVFMAVLAPVFGVTRRDAQINRRATDRNALDQNRLTVDDRGTRIAADVDLAIEAGLADADRDTDISSVGCGSK